MRETDGQTDSSCLWGSWDPSRKGRKNRKCSEGKVQMTKTQSFMTESRLWRAEQKREIFGTRTAYRKKFPFKPLIPMESIYSDEVPFGSQPTKINNPKWGTPNQKFLVPVNSFHLTYPR